MKMLAIKSYNRFIINYTAIKNQYNNNKTIIEKIRNYTKSISMNHINWYYRQCRPSVILSND